MHIAIAHERFIFRFGVDRVLLLIAEGLKAKGHSVTLMANKADESVAAHCANRLLIVPEPAGDYYHSNEHAAQWLAVNWEALFAGGGAPDVVLVGGWPFMAAIRTFRERGVPVVFMDQGVVPLDGYSGGQLAVLEKLQRLRRAFLPHCAAVVAGSHFIETSQSRVDAPIVPRVQTIWNGADHLARKLWQVSNVPASPPAGNDPSQLVEKLRAEGFRVLLNLGRWETGCYKNSEAVLPFMQALAARGVKAKCLVLAREEDLHLEGDAEGRIVPIGFPDDEQLEQVMRQCDLGVGVSLWEGFNLPLAEMQSLRRPALVYAIGAHPEVVAHPWFLCRDADEMAKKAAELLGGGGPGVREMQQSYEAFDAKFRWSHVVDRYEAVLSSAVHRGVRENVRILVDVSNAARDAANSGVIRVTRRICRELQEFCEPLFVVWDREHGRYAFPTEDEYRVLGEFNGPRVPARRPVSPGHLERILLDDAVVTFGSEPVWLLLTETILETDGAAIRATARRHGMRIGAIFYDAIALLRPELVGDVVIRDNHAAYMRGLAEVDLVIPISEFSGASLHALWTQWQVHGADIEVNALPGEFFSAPRQAMPQRLQKPVSILCVATLEPRKNHRNLIKAVKRMAAERPDLPWTLTLIGNRYAGGDDVAEMVQRAAAEEPRIRWLGITPDAQVHEAYRDCTFTVYPSEIEGFGLPIMESLWHGKPCICHSGGVMAELGRDGGCLNVDVTDGDTLAAAVVRLAEDAQLYDKLSREAVSRPIKLWRDYALGMWRSLIEHSSQPSALATRQEASDVASEVITDYKQLLYPGCLVDNWQMNDSERLSMAAVLQRLKPRCAIEIGTYKGGSLSLLRQFATSVFSIDIDPEVAEKFSGFKNVTFLTGRSQELLPVLLDELDAAGMPVSFVLVDGDHSANGVRQDIELLLDYVPKVPMVVMIHDGFNPECRRGMLEARWSRSPYVHFVDVDFIPGRVIEHGGGGDGEMWGGLALAFFSPQPRQGNLRADGSMKRNFEKSAREGGGRAMAASTPALP